MEYDKKTFPIRAKADFYVHGEQPADKVQRISKALHDAAPEIEKAGNAYVNAGSVLAGCLQRIEDAAVRMSQIWGDKASVEAQLALKSLHETIDKVSGRFNHMGRPLESLGNTILPKYGDTGGWDGWGDHSTAIQGINFLWYDNGTGGGTSWFASANDVATKHLQRLNHDLETWYNLLPPDVSRTLPKIDASTPIELGLLKPDPTKGTGGTGGGPGVSTAGFDPSAVGGSPGGSGVVPGGVAPGTEGTPPSGPGDIPPGGPNPGGTTPPGTGQGGSPTGGAGVPGGSVAPSPGATPPPQTTPNPPEARQPDLPQQPQVPDPNADVEGKNPDQSIQNPRDTESAGYQQPRFDPPTTTTTTPPSSVPVQSPAEIRHPSSTPWPGLQVGGGAETGMGRGNSYAAMSPAVARTGDLAGTGVPPLYPPVQPGGQPPAESTDGTLSWLHEEDDVWGGPPEGTIGHTIHHDLA